MDERSSVLLIRALSRVWSSIRRLHPDVPGVVLLPAPNPHRETGVLGHFAPLRWSAKNKDGTYFHEVVVVAEHLDRSAADVVETLLHEAAHAMNFSRGIKDYSANQYHNRHFASAAEELGLTVAQVPHYGFAATSLPDATRETYIEEIKLLQGVLIHRQEPTRTRNPDKGSTPTTGGNDPVRPTGRNCKAVCACPFIIRASRATLRDTVIRCETCGEPFRLA